MKCLLIMILTLYTSYGCCCAQRVALRTNLLLWSTTTPNAGVEFSMGRHFTFELTGAYNAWKFDNDMKLNLYLAQPDIGPADDLKDTSLVCTDTMPTTTWGSSPFLRRCGTSSIEATSTEGASPTDITGCWVHAGLWKSP